VLIRREIFMFKRIRIAEMFPNEAMININRAHVAVLYWRWREAVGSRSLMLRKSAQ
jgi:hypothetical protein